MKILVTGGAGMIGSNLSHRLVALGHDVRIVDNLWRGSENHLLNFFTPKFIREHLVIADLSQPSACQVVTEGVELVFHLADVVAGIGYVFKNQHSIWQENILINTNTLAAAIDNDVRHLIYVGTACSYPEHLTAMGAEEIMLREEQAYPAQPESAYGWSKLMGEYAVELAQKEGLIDATILRLHNVFGFPTEFTGDRAQVIPALTRKVVRYPEEDFVVWGSGEQKRSFIFVDDVVDALILAMSNGVNSGPIQIGPSQSTSIKQIAESLAEISGKGIEPIFDRSKPEGDGNRVGDFSKAAGLLGWSQKTNLEEGLRLTYEWVKQQIIEEGEVSGAP
jgi:nucleoside-diphosphate-sugar epimerase